MAETFQDRLVTELQLTGASSIGEVNSVLEQFLPRFNRRFRVPTQHPEPALRPLDPELCLDQSLCFKHRRKVAKDNTVRFQLRTLQLLPGRERPSYDGAAVEVLQGLDGRLSVCLSVCLCSMRGASSRPRRRHQFGISPERPRSLRKCSCPDLRCPRPGRTLDGGSRTVGLKGGGRERSRYDH